MPKFKDLTGQRFGRLTVIERTQNSASNQTQWICRCECGHLVTVRSASLLNGHTRSCGCYADEVRKVNTDRTTHSLSDTRLYRIWAGMKARCSNPHVKIYRHYGGRGIKVCPAWQDFQVFYEWAIHNGYSDDLSIDRIDVNGDYEPDNCRWADKLTQMNNTSANRYYEFAGKKMTLPQVERALGYSAGLLTQRINKLGMPFEEAVKRPSRCAV